MEQILSELRSYQWDDARLVQDSVMALAIALAHVRIWSSDLAPGQALLTREEKEDAGVEREAPIMAGVFERSF